ncbi:putative quinol monooxygenase [Paludibacterium yongneupense]|uniref:putative quinol monooxygenase n=1 Tax=Paludibacterium yongneupense TaxID=400061 RepID=UPI0004050F21|nr:putative quinol monooxygenase [Paludibacterium yongneupense]
MYLTCIFNVRPESRDALLNALASLVEHSHSESGTLQYEVLVDRDDENRIIVFERYSGAPALQAHLESAAVSSTLARFDEWLDRPPLLIKSKRFAGFVHSGLDNQI